MVCGGAAVPRVVRRAPGTLVASAPSALPFAAGASPNHPSSSPSSKPSAKKNGGATSPALSDARASTLKERQDLLDMICDRVPDATVTMQDADLPAAAGLASKVVGAIVFVVMAIVAYLVAQSLFS